MPNECFLGYLSNDTLHISLLTDAFSIHVHASALYNCCLMPVTSITQIYIGLTHQKQVLLSTHQYATTSIGSTYHTILTGAEHTNWFKGKSPCWQLGFLHRLRLMLMYKLVGLTPLLSNLIMLFILVSFQKPFTALLVLERWEIPLTKKFQRIHQKLWNGWQSSRHWLD